MDGTLLDSEPLWGAAMDALAAHHGGLLSEAARLSMVGRNASESMAIFYSDVGVADPDLVTDELFLAERMGALFAEGVPWRPGATELLAEVRTAGLPTALVTSTARRLVEVVLDSTLGRGNFNVVICGDEVAEAKPHPEAYRTAASQLGVPIEQCVAIEDSPTGILSASAAGARVIGVPGELPLAGVDGAHLVTSLVEVDLGYLTRLAATARA
ncbi:HAD family phosphatase [Natronosporangium hydrolyticum]|uniref:HAD family phosphatase n=2 Tax=Natronosporangium hydrolyticum TaxID=2811111 RepID=A0A895YP98_9ACTN|nr:HAD family phosphatase [Natronosporangium hydrolyticum]